MDPVSIIVTTVGWLANPIFKKVADVAWQQFTKRVGLQAEIDDLRKELQNFQVPVETADTTKYLKEFKELVDEAKDLLDELDYFRLQDEVKQKNKAEQGNNFSKLKSPSQSDIPSSSTKGTFKELKLDKKGISSRMKDLIKNLKQRQQSLNPNLQHQMLSSIVESIEKVNNRVVSSGQPKITSLPLEDKIYGRDGEIMQIQNLLNYVKNSQKLPVIAIVGNGGTGKTTLAQQVYNHPAIIFDLRIWICVSTHFDEMEFTRQMLERCSGDVRRCDGENLDNLKSILISKLKGQKVLLVLDDIWEIKSKREWNSLLAPLNPINGTMVGTTVLVTTRFPKIAQMFEAIDPIIILDGLDESSSWSLLKYCVFGNDQCDIPHRLEDIGRHIGNRIKGYPLAVKTVGALLKRNIDVAYWNQILEGEQWKFREGKDDIMPTLRLSYEYLPVHLKQCFSYCALFPKDHYFMAEELVYMWMAQDFINSTNDKKEENVGFDYLNELVEGAFFQKVVERQKEKYVVHDLMHDLAQVVSSGEFLAITQPEPFPYPHSLCHLSFLLDVNYTIENYVLQNLSSLVISKNAEALKHTINWHQVTRFRFRMLILPSMSPISYNFTHLRYLKLYYPWDEETTFPVEIFTLYHLQVLELELFGYSMDLPKEFNNLVNLRHFIAHEELHSQIVGVGKLKHLQELKKFVVREEKGFELGQLSELKELRGSVKICGLQNVRSKGEAENVKLSKKEIDNLELYWDKLYWNKQIEDKPRKNRGGREKWRTWLNGEGKECSTSNTSSEQILEALRPRSELKKLCIENYGGCKSPTWLTNHSIKYLDSIRLSNCETLEELPNFGQLMYLKELYLSNLPKVKAFGPQFHGCGPQEGFPSLKVMDVSRLHELKTWVWSQGFKVFPSLEDLNVKSCPNLVKFSFFNFLSVHGESTEWFPKLKYLTVSYCPQLQAVPQEIFSYIYTCGIPLADIDLGFGEIDYTGFRDDLNIHEVKDPEVLASIFKTFKNICSMQFSSCSNLTPLSWKCICMIHSLKTLRFYRCYGLRFSLASEEEKDDGSTFYSHESLEKLVIHKCGVTGEELSYLLAHLPAIRKLSIKNCDNVDLVSLPGIIDETNKFSYEPGFEVDKYQQRTLDSLMCLEELYIKYCPNMVFTNERGLSGLTALKTLKIRGSEKLIYSLNQKEGSSPISGSETQ